MNTHRIAIFLSLLLPCAAVCDDRVSNNPVGIHLMIQDAMTDQNIETHLGWARHLCGEGGWIKAMIYPITSDRKGADESWKKLIRRAYELGLNACLRMDEPLGNASPPGKKGDYAEIAAAYKRVARDLLAANPTERPIYFEIRNEPNNANEWSNAPDPIQYGRFYVAVARAIRSLQDERAKVAVGALSPGGSFDNLRFIDLLCTVEGFADSLDAWATHCYPGQTPPEINLHDKTADNRYGAIDGYMLELAHLRRGGVDTSRLPVLITEMSFDGNDDYAAALYLRAWRDFWMQWPEVLAVCPYYLVSLWAQAPEPHEWVWAGATALPDGLPSRAHANYWTIAGMAKPTEATGAINGFVRDPFGNVIADATVTVSAATTTASSAAGLYQFSNLPPGEYALAATQQGYDATSAVVTVAAGRNTAFDLTLPLTGAHGHALVTVLDATDRSPLSGAVVQLATLERRAETDRAGTAVLRGLRPGDYRVRVYKDGYDIGWLDLSIRAAPNDAPPTVEASVVLHANLLANGGMEPLHPEDRSVAGGWQSPDRAPHPWMHIDNTVKRSGLASQRIDAGGAGALNYVSHWTPYSSIVPGATYEAVAHIQTLGLVRDASAGARLRLMFYSNDNEHTPLAVFDSEAVDGDTPWRESRVVALAPSGADRLRTVLQADAPRGSAWFDDVFLHVTLPPPPPLETLVADLGDRWRERRLFGLNVVWGHSGGTLGMTDEHYRQLISLLREAGSTLTKVGVAWADIERSPGVLDWSHADSLGPRMAGDGLELVCVYACVPDWAKNMSSEDYQRAFGGHHAPLATVVMPRPEHADAYRAFTTTMAQRYAKVFRRFEFWNEPDSYSGPIVLRDKDGRAVDVRYNGDPVEYTYWLRHAYESIKQGNPEAQIAVGGLVSFETGFLEGIYANGGGAYFDAVAIHPYDDAGINKDWIRAIRQVMLRNGDAAKPIWITEYGWWIGVREADAARGIFPAQLEQQARYLRDAIEFFRRQPYIQVAVHHTLNDWRSDENNPESLQPMGLVTHNLQHRKPAFREWQALARESLERGGAADIACALDGPDFCYLGDEIVLRCSAQAHKGALPPGHAVLIHLPEERVVATWSIAAATTSLVFDYRYQPSVADMRAAGNGFALEYRRVPGREIARADHFVEVASPLAFHPLSATAPYDLSPRHKPAIQVVNYAAVPVSFYPAGDIAGRAKLTVPPLGSTTLPLGLEMAPTPGVASFEVAALVHGETWTVQRYFYTTPIECPRRTDKPPAAQLRLEPDRARQDFADAAHYYAQVSCDYTDSVLHLRVLVNEQQHTQTRQPHEMWREDSVQIAIDPARDGAAACRYDPNDHEYGFALINKQPVVWRWAAPPLHSYVGLVDEVKLQVQRGNGVTGYDVEIPWSVLGIETPELGRLIGIAIVVNDAGPAGRRFLEWPADAITTHKTPARFGSLRLVE